MLVIDNPDPDNQLEQIICDPKLVAQAKAEAVASVIFDALTPDQRFEIAWGEPVPSCNDREVADKVQEFCYLDGFNQ